MIGLTDNLDDLIQIQIDNQIAFQHLKSRGDLAKAVFRPSLQHGPTMRQPRI